MPRVRLISYSSCKIVFFIINLRSTKVKYKNLIENDEPFKWTIRFGIFYLEVESIIKRNNVAIQQRIAFYIFFQCRKRRS